MNQIALRQLIGGSVLVWVVCTVMLMTHSVPQQQRVGAQAAPTVPPTAAATAEAAPEQLARPVYLPLVSQGPGTTPEPVPLPTSAATVRYVRWDWNDQVIFFDPITEEPNLVRLAYVKGYNATQGSPLSTIILAFGRQLEDGRKTSYGEVLTGWHVQLPPDDRPGIEDRDRVKDHSWVISVAESFLRGYNNNPAHTGTVIAIGTSNGNFAWNCDNGGLVSGLWWQAGQQWREVVEQIQVPGLKITLVSANDIESWFGEFPIRDEEGNFVEFWTACGIGAQQWYAGYEIAVPDKILPNLNFGSDVRRELPEQWTAEQTFDVLFDIRSTRAHPQLYCSQWVDPLVNFSLAYGDDIFFYGVTSENNGNLNTCGVGNGSLQWQQSWLQFRDGLNAAGLQNKLAPSVSSFCIFPADSDKRCARYGAP